MVNVLILGSHVSYNNQNQLVGCLKEALNYGANAFMFYTGAPQNTIRGEISDTLRDEALKQMQLADIDVINVICHAPYIINLANNIDPDKYAFAISFLRSEIERCLRLKIKRIVLHPGSATKLDRKIAIDNIVYALNAVLKPDDDIVILLETMAGKGTEIGSSMAEIAYIIENINLKDKVGVCLDTCHLNDSGVDISCFDEYLDQFDMTIGIQKIGCVHVNDSKNILASHKDRHENIGYGAIGFDNLLRVIYNPRLADVPKILETPYIDREYPPYRQEIEMIRKKSFNSNLYDDIISYYRDK